MQTLIEALSRPEPPQPKEGKHGDPQLAALCQFLVQNNWENDHVLVDFGSGNGVLAETLNNVYPPDKKTPQYWAIDFQELLNNLSLPSRIHNNSQKYITQEFLDNVLPDFGKNISCVVIRNVIHELNISETATLLNCFRKYLSEDCLIYIQDMERLHVPERNNIGWLEDIFHDCLKELGFNIKTYGLKGKSGTSWYAMLCLPSGFVDEIDVLSIVAKHRAKQLKLIEEEIVIMTKDYEKTQELVLLQHEFTTLSLQLKSIGWLPNTPGFDPSLKSINIPISKPQSSLFEYSCAMDFNVVSSSGLIAMLSSKELLDFPTLITSSTKTISFGGYSNRPLFLSKRNTNALKQAIKNGVTVQVLIVDPNSQAAILRSREPLYETPDTFLMSINETIEKGQLFFNNLIQEVGIELATDKFKFCASSRTPRWSYFIVDDTCYLSFYSIKMSGSSAPCFIFRGIKGVANNYYHVVRQEFLDLFDEATSLI